MELKYIRVYTCVVCEKKNGHCWWFPRVQSRLLYCFSSRKHSLTRDMKNSWIEEKTPLIFVWLREGFSLDGYREKDDDSVNWRWTKKKKERDNDLVPVEKQLNGIEEICNDLVTERGKRKEKANIKLERETRSNNRWKMDEHKEYDINLIIFNSTICLRMNPSSTSLKRLLTQFSFLNWNNKKDP